MWYIQEEFRKKAPKYWLGGTQTNGRTIGRKLVDIRLKASSVSRVHAKICVHKASFYAPAGPHRQITAVSVVDSSAYGTFLKYPRNHVAGRQEPAGHHRRLNKDDPTEVYEGALLAFGAPSSWWQVCWYPLLVLPSRLPVTARARLEEVAALTSLEVAEQMSENVTHLITSSCVSTSQKFLLMLARNQHVVQPAWLEALLVVVQNACTTVTVADSDDIACSATSLPLEENYVPPFSDEDAASYVPDVLQNVLKPTQRTKRKNMFDNIVFAFEGRIRSTWWAPIVDLLGGTTVLSEVLSGRPELCGRRILYVSDRQIEENKIMKKVTSQSNKEKVMIESILRADLSPIESAFETVRDGIFEHEQTRIPTDNTVQKSEAPLVGAEVVDVATPELLDTDSDDEKEMSGAAEAYGTSNANNGCNVAEANRMSNLNNGGDVAKANRTVQAREANVKAVAKKLLKRRTMWKKFKASNTDADSQKRIRSTLQKEPANTNAENGRAVTQRTGIDTTVQDGIKFDAERDNEREFFPVPSALSQPTLSAVPGCSEDVRPFRRRRLPSASSVPLKRVKVLDETNIYNTGGRRLLVSKEDKDNSLTEAKE